MGIMTVIAIAILATALGFYMGVKYNQRVMAPLFRITSKKIHDLAYREGVSDGRAKTADELKRITNSNKELEREFLEGQHWGLQMARTFTSPEELQEAYDKTYEEIRQLQSEQD